VCRPWRLFLFRQPNRRGNTSQCLERYWRPSLLPNSWTCRWGRAGRRRPAGCHRPRNIRLPSGCRGQRSESMKLRNWLRHRPNRCQIRIPCKLPPGRCHWLRRRWKSIQHPRARSSVSTTARWRSRIRPALSSKTGFSFSSGPAQVVLLSQNSGILPSGKWMYI